VSDVCAFAFGVLEMPHPSNVCAVLPDFGDGTGQEQRSSGDVVVHEGEEERSEGTLSTQVQAFHSTLHFLQRTLEGEVDLLSERVGEGSREVAQVLQTQVPGRPLQLGSAHVLENKVAAFREQRHETHVEVLGVGKGNRERALQVVPSKRQTVNQSSSLACQSLLKIPFIQSWIEWIRSVSH
jgi:hypothetical protein